jgi:hypothetical protein
MSAKMRKATFNPLIRESEIETVPTGNERKLEEGTIIPLTQPVRKTYKETWESNFGGSDDGFHEQQEHRVGYRTYFAAFLLFFGGIVSLLFVILFAVLTFFYLMLYRQW